MILTAMRADPLYRRRPAGRSSNANANRDRHLNAHSEPDWHTTGYAYGHSQVCATDTYGDCYVYANADSYGNIHADPDPDANLYSVLHVHLLHRRYDRSR